MNVYKKSEPLFPSLRSRLGSFFGLEEPKYWIADSTLQRTMELEPRLERCYVTSRTNPQLHETKTLTRRSLRVLLVSLVSYKSH